MLQSRHSQALAEEQARSAGAQREKDAALLALREQLSSEKAALQAAEAAAARLNEENLASCTGLAAAKARPACPVVMHCYSNYAWDSCVKRISLGLTEAYDLEGKGMPLHS